MSSCQPSKRFVGASLDIDLDREYWTMCKEERIEAQGKVRGSSSAADNFEFQLPLTKQQAKRGEVKTVEGGR